MAYGSFEDLEVWKRACRLAVKVYEVLRDCRDYGLRDQMTRAAVSIASNIAEGAERGSSADFIRFLHIAKGSSAELRTQVYIAQQAQLISNEVQVFLAQELKTLSSMLHSLIESLRKGAQNPSRQTQDLRDVEITNVPREIKRYIRKFQVPKT